MAGTTIGASAIPTPVAEKPLPARVQSGADRLGPVAMPVLITVREGDEDRVIATGIYVPEHTEPLDLLDLTPAEQHAVRQVLGIQQDSFFHDPI